jgi:glycerol-1-phosphate dehydrogenase [NAD(P)+]
MRKVTIPFFLKIDSGLMDTVAHEVVSLFGESMSPVIVTDALVKELCVGRIAQSLESAKVAYKVLLVADNTLAEVDAVVREAEMLKRDPVIVGVGGGRVLDVAKMAAAKAGWPFVSVPTVMSHDGICSPIAVLKDSSGKSHSLGAGMPHGLIGDLDVIACSPPRTRRSGVGDLVSNLSALADWRLAQKQGQETIDDFAYLLSNSATLSVMKSENWDVEDKLFLREVLNGLVLSGIAMEIAGTSRPCSGGEHEFSHALDALGSPALHGEQVAVGTLLCAYLRGEDWRTLRDRFATVGLPVDAAGLGIDADTVVRALVEAPATRPGRYTILEHLAIEAKIAREAALATGVI